MGFASELRPVDAKNDGVRRLREVLLRTTQAELARRLRAVPNTLGQWVRGERSPEPAMRTRLHEVLQIPVFAWDLPNALHATHDRNASTADCDTTPDGSPHLGELSDEVAVGAASGEVATIDPGVTADGGDSRRQHPVESGEIRADRPIVTSARAKLKRLVDTMQRLADDIGRSDAPLHVRVSALRAMVTPIRLLMQAEGELGASEAAVLGSPAVQRLLSDVIEALAPFPDALRAVHEKINPTTATRCHLVDEAEPIETPLGVASERANGAMKENE